MSMTVRTLAFCAAALVAASVAAQEATPRTPSGPKSAEKAAAFRQADANGDGRVSIEEAGRITGITQQVFNNLDTNKNGSLDENEFAMYNARANRQSGTK